MVPCSFTISEEIKIQRSETKKGDIRDDPLFGELQEIAVTRVF